MVEIAERELEVCPVCGGHLTTLIVNGTEFWICADCGKVIEEKED